MTTVTNVYVISEGERDEGTTPVAVARTPVDEFLEFAEDLKRNM